MDFDLPKYLTAKQQLVERHLGELLNREIEAPASLLEAMRYSLLAPGKRMRPVLVFMAAEAAGGIDDQAIGAACAVEMIHTYSLIHDDLPAMDDDDLRRGLPTCHKKFGDALAILAGDALLTMAFQTLAENYPPRTVAVCCRELSRGAGASGMVGGQVEDLGAAGNPASGDALRSLEHIHQQKTGALFRSCLKLGVYAAQGERPGGPDKSLLERLDTFGRCFGLVFQITDDLIDVEGNAADTGKQVGKDAAHGKLTYPGLLGADESRRRAKELAGQALDSIRPCGNSGTPLASLLQFVLARDR